MRYAFLGMAAAFLLGSAACEQIHEPWIREDNPLTQERARAPEVRQALQHRILWVQTDR